MTIIKIEIIIEKEKLQYLLMDLETIYLVKEPFPETKKFIEKLKDIKNENFKR